MTMTYDDKDTEGHRPVPSQGFGELSKYPLPKCPQGQYADVGPVAGGTVNDFGLSPSAEVGLEGNQLCYGIAKDKGTA